MAVDAELGSEFSRAPEFFGLFGHCLALRIELCLESPDLLILRSDQRCVLLLMRTNQSEQRFAIESIQIRQ